MTLKEVDDVACMDDDWTVRDSDWACIDDDWAVCDDDCDGLTAQEAQEYEKERLYYGMVEYILDSGRTHSLSEDKQVRCVIDRINTLKLRIFQFPIRI